MESSRERKLRQKLRAQQVQVREKNKAERRLLSRRLTQLELSSRRAGDLLDHQLNVIQRQFRQQRVINEDNAAFESRLADTGNDEQDVYDAIKAARRPNPLVKSASSISLPRKPSSLALLDNRRPEQVCWKPALEKPKPRCRFGAWGNRCANFPCDPFESYNNIGFDLEQNGSAPVSFKTGTVLYARARESLILDLESSSVRRPLKTSNDQTSRKIVSLKQIIEQMKVKSEKNRPKDWCINYGKPISMRKLLKVARPTSRGVSAAV